MSYESDPWIMGQAAAQDLYRPLGNDPWTNTMRGTPAAPGQGFESPSPVLYKTASPLTDITEADLNRATDLAMAFSGGGLTTKGIRAYHGSPHDFDRFDISKIGTGEGTQAYGHGLYFADKEGIARSYRDALSRDRDRVLETGGTLPSWVANTMASRNPMAIEDMRNTFQGRLREARQKLADPDTMQPWNIEAQIPVFERILKSIDEFAAGAELKPAGRMYEVNIRADPAHLLDWDKGLNQQLPEISDRLRSAFDRHYGKGFFDEWSGNAEVADIYRNLDDIHPGKASQLLKAVEIPGVRYLDQGSRAAGAGSSNYVVFDDSLIDILRKYGIAGAAPAGIGALAAQDQYGVAP